MVDPRISILVEKAKEKRPDLFASINAAVGRHGETGYSNFYNKGTGHAYCLFAKDGKLYLSLWVSEAARRTKEEKVEIYEDKFDAIMEPVGPVIRDTDAHHMTPDRVPEVIKVDVTTMENEMIIEYMTKLVR